MTPETGASLVAGIEKTIRVGDVDLRVFVAGKGPDVLLVHGFPDTHDVWREQVPVLVRAGYRVIAPDLRGFGASSMPAHEKDYALDKLVGDVVGILDAMDIPRVRLVGHDWGAVIGWQVCLRHPERVDRYVAMSVGHPQAYARLSFEQRLKAWYVLFFQLRGLAERTLRFGNWWPLRRFARFEAEGPNWIRNLERPGRLTAALGPYRANFRDLVRTPWPPVKVPVLGLWSDGDVFLAESQMVDSGSLVDAPWRYERIAGANHWMQLAAPARVNQLLLDYLA